MNNDLNKIIEDLENGNYITRITPGYFYNPEEYTRFVNTKGQKFIEEEALEYMRELRTLRALIGNTKLLESVDVLFDTLPEILEKTTSLILDTLNTLSPEDFADAIRHKLQEESKEADNEN